MSGSVYKCMEKALDELKCCGELDSHHLSALILIAQRRLDDFVQRLPADKEFGTGDYQYQLARHFPDSQIVIEELAQNT